MVIGHPACLFLCPVPMLWQVAYVWQVAYAPFKPWIPSHHPMLACLGAPPGAGLDRAATLLRLWPGDAEPVPLSQLHDSRSLHTEQPGVWQGGVSALYSDAAGGDSGGRGGPYLGDRRACALAALRLAMLAQLQQPLAQLEGLIRGAGAGGLGDAPALLLHGFAAGGGGACLTPIERGDALRLVHTVSAIRCHPPDPGALGALLRQLQGPEEAERRRRRRQRRQQRLRRRRPPRRRR